MNARIGPSAFGDGLYATRDLAAGETVLLENALVMLLDDVPPSMPGLLAAMSSALGLPPESDKVRLLTGGLELWLQLDMPSRAAVLRIFNTPDDSEMSVFVRGIVASVQQESEELRACEPEDLTRALCCWLLASHGTATGSALYAIASCANHSVRRRPRT